MKSRGSFEAVCDYCGKTYYTHKSAYQKQKRHFCSRMCYSKHRSERLTVEEQNAFHGNSILTICNYCGKEYYTYKSAYEKRERHFCSRTCYAKYRSEQLPHEEQNAYGRGHSLEERKRRKKARHTLNHHLRDKHIERHPCEFCGAPNGEAHHDNYDNPLEVRWLCRKCHRKWHKEHGCN